MRRSNRKFRAGVAVVAAFYLAALFADFIAPNDYRAQSRREIMSPPVAIRLRDGEGRWHARPFVYRRRLADPLRRIYEEDTTRAYPLALFARGHRYRLLGLFETDVHLFGVRAEDAAGIAEAPRVYLLGTDALGRDRFARLLVAARFTLLVGPLGTILASLVGIVVGVFAGYAGRAVEAILMRAADVMMSLPTLIVILAARAAFPLELPPGRAARLLIGIFVAVGWAETARLARGLVLTLKTREYVLAAESLGLSKARILFRHILPNAARPLVVQATLLLPAFLLAETSLSFLGVGVQEPEPSWGNMLAAASDINLLAAQPLLLLAPAVAIFLFVFAVRLVGDGLKARGGKNISS
ncbi:MAG TPA: ABC transporter permease [Pyrinomonadaceae bacterium]|nr:ABC transporter permease [Pyrinomonadaceae bacterium]